VYTYSAWVQAVGKGWLGSATLTSFLHLPCFRPSVVSERTGQSCSDLFLSHFGDRHWGIPDQTWLANGRPIFWTGNRLGKSSLNWEFHGISRQLEFPEGFAGIGVIE